MGLITDEATCDYVAGLLGDEHATERQTTADPVTHRTVSVNVAERTRDKATAAELQQLRTGRALLVQGAAPPAMVSLPFRGPLRR